jgi:precorrin-6Y C5,15-methyltransferase (decarboxylating)
VTVGENLSYFHEDNNLSADTGHVDSIPASDPNTRTKRIDSFSASDPDTKIEYIFIGTASECAERSFSDLAVLLVDTKTPDGKQLIQCRRPAGMPDDVFARGKVPMTKMEVRCVILGKMAVSENDVVWDIGAGTGSVSVELAMQARQVWAVERRDEAVELIRENREKFGRWNLRIAWGEAPMDLKELPDPDAVFVGGSGGHLGEILHEVWRRNENARICISATLLETLQESLEAFLERGIEPDIVQIAVTRSEKIGGRHMMRAGNPIYIITGSYEQ